MPSTVMIPTVSGLISGGISLVPSGQAYVYSGSPFQVIGGVALRYDMSGPGVVYVGVTNLSGLNVTITSGVSGFASYTDGMPLGRGDAYFVPKLKLVSGLESIRVGVPLAASGGFLFWEIF